MIEILDNILLSNNVVENFYSEYNSNKEFKQWLLKFLPEIEACNKLKQDNPWHIYTCLTHILWSVNHMNTQTLNISQPERRMLAYTMFFHDIGKPQCYVRRFSKLYNREVDSFYNHNLASVEIAKKVLNKLDFNSQDCEIILKLVLEHDLFMSLSLEPTTNKYKHMLTQAYLKKILLNMHTSTKTGKEIMQYLLMVGRADNLAQNPQLTGPSLNMLNVMGGMLEQIN